MIAKVSWYIIINKNANVSFNQFKFLYDLHSSQYIVYNLQCMVSRYPIDSARLLNFHCVTLMLIPLIILCKKSI